jgi:predicted acetyltransferase
MTEIIIRDLPYQEAAPHVNLLTSYALRPSPPSFDDEIFVEQLKHTDATTRHLVTFEGEQPVACAGAGEMTQNVRGKLLEMSGIIRVATHPYARRKGYAFQVLTELLKAERDNGQAMTCLYPFRESFYGRLGYVSFPVGVKAQININALLPLARQGFGDEVELVNFLDDPDLYFNYVKEHLENIHGMAAFKTFFKLDPARHDSWLAVHRINGKVDALMSYRLEGSTPTKYKFNINRFYYRNAASRYQFLGWIARHIDQTNQVVIALPVYEQPYTWFNDLDLQVECNWIAPMGRVLDITRIDGIAAGDGAFSAKIVDPTCLWNEGIWQFESQDGKLVVSPGKNSDCDLSIQGLSALVYGTNPPEDFQFRGWGDPPSEVQEEMRKMFPVALPHIHEFF